MADDKSVPEIYSDGVGRNRLSGGVIRIDLVSATEAYDQGGDNVPTEVTHRVIMSLPAFVKSVHTMNQLFEQLDKAGVFKRAEKVGGEST